MIATLTIARNAFVEITRQPIYLVLILLAAALQYLNTAISAYSMGYSSAAGEVTGDDKLLLDIGLATVFVLGILLAAFVATSTLSKEIENKTVLTVVSKPIGRAAVVIGKYLGVAAAISIAVTLMTLFLLLALRHGVMSTAADDLDQPVLVFGVGSIALALAVGAVGNFLYNWSFAQTALIALVPLQILGWLATLFIGPEWSIQPPGADLKPEVLKACAGIAVAILVMSAIATAASTRLGQVMTIVVCAGVLFLGLLSNHLLGRQAFLNVPITRVAEAEPTRPRFEGLRSPGDTYTITLDIPPEIQLEVGDPFYFGPSPDGVGMVTPPMAELPEDIDLSRDLFPATVPPALVITEISGPETLTIKHIGGSPYPLARPPESGDSVFEFSRRTNPVAVGAWALIPNLHFFWMVDAVTQASPIPITHLAAVAGYGALQIVTFLALAVLLFEGRDVG